MSEDSADNFLAGVALETKLRQVCLDNQKIRQLATPSATYLSRRGQKLVRGDKSSKGAFVLPRSTTFCEQQTKTVFLVINLSVNSVKLEFFSLHISLFLATFVVQCCFMVTIMNPSYPFDFNIYPDQTNLCEAQDRYSPGQLFWRRNQSENHQQIAENTFAATSTVLAPFQP